MIATIIITGLAFAWLGYETDWMLVRLPMGIDTLPIEQKYKTWEELKPGKILKAHPFWLRFPDLMEPMGGWDWVKNTMHIIPEVKIELIAEHSHYTMRTENTDILRDAFRVYRNPYLKVRV